MRSTRRSLGLLALSVMASAVAACGGGPAAQGGERQRCYLDGTCNDGLTCASDLCVRINNGTAGTTGAGGIGGSSDGTAGAAGDGGNTAGAAGTTSAGTGGGVAGSTGVAGNTGAGGGAAGDGGTTGTAGTTGAGGNAGPCPFPFDYGVLASATMPAAAVANGAYWEYPLPGGVAGDSLKLSLRSPSMTGQVAHTGTFPLSGPELDYATCGVCLRIESPLVNGYSDMYMATGGTVTITSLSPRFTGTISGATFHNVRLDGLSHSIALGDGCTSVISSFSFDVLSF